MIPSVRGGVGGGGRWECHYFCLQKQFFLISYCLHVAMLFPKFLEKIFGGGGGVMFVR